jgi:hypothetical protein
MIRQKRTTTIKLYSFAPLIALLCKGTLPGMFFLTKFKEIVTNFKQPAAGKQKFKPIHRGSFPDRRYRGRAREKIELPVTPKTA